MSNVSITLILWPISERKYLMAIPKQRWQIVLAKLLQHSLTDRKFASVERCIANDSDRVFIDRFGRFCIREDLSDALGLKSEVTLVGRLQVFEIWDPGTYAQQKVEDRGIASTIFNEIDL